MFLWLSLMPNNYFILISSFKIKSEANAIKIYYATGLFMFLHVRPVRTKMAAHA